MTAASKPRRPRLPRWAARLLGAVIGVALGWMAAGWLM